MRRPTGGLTLICKLWFSRLLSRESGEVKRVEHDDRSTKKTSAIEIVKDIAASICLLVGSWLLLSLAALFPNSKPPLIVTIILSISGITLLLYFLGALFRAFSWTYRCLDEFILSVSISYSWAIMRKALVYLDDIITAQDKEEWSFKRANLIRRLGCAFLIAVDVVSIPLLIVFVAQKLPSSLFEAVVASSIATVSAVFILFQSKSILHSILIFWPILLISFVLCHILPFAGVSYYDFSERPLDSLFHSIIEFLEGSFFIYSLSMILISGLLVVSGLLLQQLAIKRR
jgi:hypothetical protein